MINNCVHGVNFAVVGKDDSLEWNRRAVKKTLMEKVNECVI